jgi:hypothetical protein
MTSLLALVAFDALRRTRLSTFIRLVTGLLAVATGKTIDTFLLAVAGAVTRFIAHVAGNANLLALLGLLFTVLGDVAEF